MEGVVDEIAGEQHQVAAEGVGDVGNVFKLLPVGEAADMCVGDMSNGQPVEIRGKRRKRNGKFADAQVVELHHRGRDGDACE